MTIAEFLGNLAHYTSLLFALTLGYSVSTLRLSSNKYIVSAVKGCLFGLFSVLSMMSPQTGIVTDVRGILIAISGTQSGYLSAVMTGIVVTMCRITSGAPLTFAFIGGVWFHVFLGCFFYLYFGRYESKTVYPLKKYALLGMVCAVITSFCVLVSSPPIIEAMTNQALLRIFIILPLTSVGVTYFLFLQQSYFESAKAVAYERKLLSVIINNGPKVVIMKGQYLKAVFIKRHDLGGKRFPNQVMVRADKSLLASKSYEKDWGLNLGDND